MPLTNEQTIRLLRAKEAELKFRFLSAKDQTEVDWFMADVSFLYGFMADHLEQHQRRQNYTAAVSRAMLDQRNPADPHNPSER